MTTRAEQLSQWQWSWKTAHRQQQQVRTDNLYSSHYLFLGENIIQFVKSKSVNEVLQVFTIFREGPALATGPSSC